MSCKKTRWNVEYTKTFLKELAHLPTKIRMRGEEIAFKELPFENPYRLKYIEQMIGYSGQYKIRIGNYRMGITIIKKEKLIICQRIAHRKDIYRAFP